MMHHMSSVRQEFWQLPSSRIKDIGENVSEACWVPDHEACCCVALGLWPDLLTLVDEAGWSRVKGRPRGPSCLHAL